jgi:hypothetical protein
VNIKLVWRFDVNIVTLIRGDVLTLTEGVSMASRTMVVRM